MFRFCNPFVEEEKILKNLSAALAISQLLKEDILLINTLAKMYNHFYLRFSELKFVDSVPIFSECFTILSNSPAITAHVSEIIITGSYS